MLSHTSIAEKSIRISWIKGDHGGKISTYSLMLSTDVTFTKKNTLYTRTLSISKHNVTQRNGTWTLIISNLSKNTSYYAMVTASNCLGSSESTVQQFSTRCSE